MASVASDHRTATPDPRDQSLCADIAAADHAARLTCAGADNNGDNTYGCQHYHTFNNPAEA